MKLLEKSEIAKGRAIEQSREIDQGKKISGYVDKLRELKVNEEQALEKWRRESLSSIGEEINELSGKRDEIKIELVYLRQELSKESPLTRKERQNLEKLKQSLGEKEKYLDEYQEKLSLYEIDLLESKKKMEDALKRARADQQTALRNLKSSETKQIEAQNRLHSSKSIEERSLQRKKEVDEELFLRKSALIAREEAVEEQEIENGVISKQNSTEKIQLADQRATLERALARLKKLRDGK